MRAEDCIKAIVKGADAYFAAFGLAKTMRQGEEPLGWIAPKKGEKGPCFAYSVRLRDEAAVDALLPALKEGTLPIIWVLTPLSEPENLADWLPQKGFTELSKDEEPEYGMAIDLDAFSVPPQRGATAIRKVETKEDLAAWMEVVNTALHGWELLTPEDYGVWLEEGLFTFYLGLIEGRPAATAAVLRTGEAASLEFVSTLTLYRHRGAALALCGAALGDQKKAGVRIATLRSAAGVDALYKKLGFTPYYVQRLFRYTQ